MIVIMAKGQYLKRDSGRESNWEDVRNRTARSDCCDTQRQHVIHLISYFCWTPAVASCISLGLACGKVN